MRANRFKDGLRAGRQQIGLWSTLHDPAVIEICASSGFDWMLLDGEHAPTQASTTFSALQAIAAYPTQAVVRPGIGDGLHLTRLLDMGVLNVLVPQVESGEQARIVSAAMCFAPEGTRGVSGQTRAGNWGRDPHFLSSARESLTLIVQIESEDGVRNLDDVLATPGIDAVFIGTADLAASLGHLGQPDHPEVVAAFGHVAAKARSRALPIGALTRSRDTARDYLAQGLAFVAVGTDSAILAGGLRALRDQFPGHEQLDQHA